MEVGMIGLGRMGAGMAQRLIQAGHMVVGYDVSETARAEIEQAGGSWAGGLTELASRLGSPRIVWLMLPPGAATDQTLAALVPLLQPGDTIVDGGNSHYQKSQAWGCRLASRQVNFLDVGTNSGIAGASEGFCLTVGGDPEVVERLRPLLDALGPSAAQGWAYVGTTGAGHFVKMVHNAISYGLMEAYAEGFGLLRAKEEFGLSLASIARLWAQGSLLDSWLLDRIAGLLAEEESLTGVRGWVDDTGSGRWAVLEALDLNVSAPILTEALLRRVRSREREPYSDKLLAALRGDFGGHEVKRRLDNLPPRDRDARWIGAARG